MSSSIDPVQLTRKLVSFKTIYPPDGEQEIAEYIGNLLEKIGFQIQYLPFTEGRPNLIARIHGRGNELPICFSGHMDTVPLGKKKWSYDPFAGEIYGDKIFGRGTSDMKSGLAAMIVMAAKVARYPLKRGMVLVFTACEESACQGAVYLVNRKEKMNNAGAMVIAEPTSNYPWIGHKGVLWLEISTTGESAHGSTPESGDNAIHRMAKVINQLQNFSFDMEKDSVFGNPTINIGTISGGSNINSVPDRATIGVDVRTIPDQNIERVIRRIQGFLGKDVEVKKIMSGAGITTNFNDPWVQNVFDIVEPFLQEQPKPYGGTYLTDASILKPALGNPPTLILGPGEAKMAHKTNEFCYCSNIEEASEIYFQIAQNWCDF